MRPDKQEMHIGRAQLVDCGVTKNLRATVLAMAPRTESASASARWALLTLVVGCLLIQLVAGAPASPLVPALPSGVRVPGWSARGARSIGLDRLEHTGLTILALALVLVLVGAFLFLILETRRGRVRAAPLLVAAGICVALSVAGPLILSRDVYSYAAYGRMFAVHQANPYALPPSAFPKDPFTPVLSPEWIHTRSVYGPLFILVSAGLGRLFRASPAATILAFKVLSGAALAGAALLAMLACRRIRPDRAAMAVVLIALNPVLIVHAVGGGHSDALVALLLAGALWFAAWALHRPGAAAVSTARAALQPLLMAVTGLLTMATLVKLPVAVALLVWLWVLLRRAGSTAWPTVGAAHAGVVVAVGAAVTAPLWVGWRTLRSLGTLAAVEGWASGLRLVSRGAQTLARAVSGPSAATTADHVVRGVFYAIFAVALWWLLRRARLETIGHAWGASLLLLALALPYLLPWYAAWFLVFLALLSDDVLLWVGVGVSLLLAMTGIPAEPGGDPGLWRDMVLGVHYVIAPVIVVLRAVVVVRIYGDGDSDGPAIATSRLPKARAKASRRS